MIPQLSPRETLARIREEVDLQNALQQLDEARQSANAATLAALTTERAVLEARHRLSLPVAVYGEPLLSPRPRVLVSPEADTRSPQRSPSPNESVTSNAYRALNDRLRQNEVALATAQQELQAVRSRDDAHGMAQTLAAVVELLTSRPKEAKAFAANKAMASSNYSKFSGSAGQDILVYAREFEGWAKHNGVAPQHWTRELCLKLEGPAAQQYELRYGDLAADSYPEFATAIASLAEYFSTPYQGASKFLAFTACKRGPGTSGKEAMLKVESVFQAMTASGTPAEMGQDEMIFYVLQNQLQVGELETFLINLSAHQDCSDNALRLLQNSTIDEDSAGPRRQSVRAANSVARADIFRRRLFLIKEFMHRCPGTGAVGPAQGGRSVAKAAMILVDQQTEAGRSATGYGSNNGIDECRLELAYATRRDTTPLPPPLYFGPNPENQPANQAEFEKRKLARACFACRQGLVNYGQPFLDCPRHGRRASDEERKADRVAGADVGEQKRPRFQKGGYVKGGLSKGGGTDNHP